MGWPHPDYLLNVLTAEQLGEWAAYFTAEPWGFPAEDLRAGILAATVARGAGSTTAEPRHFMIRPPEEPEEPEDELERLKRVLGGG